MNFYWVYDLPNIVFGLMTIAFFIIIAVSGLFLLRGFISTRIIPQSHNDIVSFFMSGMGAIYGITLGLIAVGAWENFNNVSDVVNREAASLMALYQDISVLPSPQKDSMQAQLTEYTKYTIEDAWPQQQQGIMPKGGTSRLKAFQKTMLSHEPKTKIEEIAIQEALSQYNTMLTYRRLRLQSVTDGMPASIWYVIVFGAMLNIVITWFFKTDSFRVHVLMTAMFAALLGSLVFLVAAMDNPFRGEFSVGSDAFQTIYENITKK